jgi:hypothetical protein
VRRRDRQRRETQATLAVLRAHRAEADEACELALGGERDARDHELAPGAQRFDQARLRRAREGVFEHSADGELVSGVLRAHAHALLIGMVAIVHPARRASSPRPRRVRIRRPARPWRIRLVP